jgi:hypothetical protein
MPDSETSSLLRAVLFDCWWHYMNTRNLVAVLVVVILVGSVLAGAAGDKSPYRASDAEASIRGATNIVFRQFHIGEEIKSQEFSIADAGELRRLTNTIRLGEETSNKCEFLLQAEFQGLSGTISTQFNNHYFVVVESPGPLGYKDHTYLIPKEFYAQFLKLAEKHSWRPEEP